MLGTRARRVAAGVAATIAALASLVSVLQFVDQKVNSSDAGQTVTTKVAQIRGVELTDTAEPLGDYLSKARPTDDRGYTDAELRRVGYEFLLSLKAKGPAGTYLRLRWVLYEEGGRRVFGAAYAQVSSDFKTAVPDQERGWAVWVPYPPRDGRYFARFILEDDDHRLVDQRDSRPFDHRV